MNFLKITKKLLTGKKKSNEKDKCRERSRKDAIKKGVLVERTPSACKSRFMVLLDEVFHVGPARIEYYNNERKWLNHNTPIRIVVLKNCFNIKKCYDNEIHRMVIHFFSKKECFSLVFKEEEEVAEWFNLIKKLSKNHQCCSPSSSSLEQSLSTVWYIFILKKDIGISEYVKDIAGLSLHDDKLECIQRCGVENSVFSLELDETSPIGSGQIYMETWNPNVSNHICDILIHLISNVRHKAERKKKRLTHSEALANRPLPCIPRCASTCSHKNPSKEHQVEKDTQGSSVSSNGDRSTINEGSQRIRCHSLPTGLQPIDEGSTSLSPLNFLDHAESTIYETCSCTSTPSQNLRIANFRDPNWRCRGASCPGSGKTYVCSSPINEKSELSKKVQDHVPLTSYDGECDVEELINKNHEHCRRIVIDEYMSSFEEESEETKIKSEEFDYSTPDGYLPMKPALPSSYPLSSYELRALTVSESIPKKKSPLYENISRNKTWNGSVEKNSNPDNFPWSRNIRLVPSDDTAEYVEMCLQDDSKPKPVDPKVESIVSGTPSTDSRFSGIHLDKVNAYITPCENDQLIEAPIRSYSAGSDSGGLRRKIDKILSNRTRTFSACSRDPLPTPGLACSSGYQSGSGSDSSGVFNQSADGMRFNSNTSLSHRGRYPEEYSIMPHLAPVIYSPRSSPELFNSNAPSVHRLFGRSLSIATPSLASYRRPPSKSASGSSRSPPISNQSYSLSPLEKVSEVPDVEHVDVDNKPTASCGIQSQAGFYTHKIMQSESSLQILLRKK